MYASTEIKENKFTGNTTLGGWSSPMPYFRSRRFAKLPEWLRTDTQEPSGRFTQQQMETVSMRFSVGQIRADQDLVGTLAAEVVSEAILKAVYSAESAYGFPSWRELCASSHK